MSEELDRRPDPPDNPGVGERPSRTDDAPPWEKPRYPNVVEFVIARLEEAESRPESTTPDRAWREAVPELRRAWSELKERSPVERPAVDRSTDPPGSWRSESDRRPGPAENRKVEDACDRIADREEDTTETLKEIEESSLGRLVGLEHRIKDRDRVKEKAAVYLDDFPAADADEAVASVADAIRYTLQYESGSYIEGMRTDIERFREKGFELVRLRNSWSDPEYKGINSRWRDEEGQIFEVQFHTEASFEAKQLSHEAYERLRNPLTGPADDHESREFQRLVSSRIPVPGGITDVPDYP